MRAVVQRTRCSKVLVNEQLVGQAGPGLTVLLGIKRGDQILSLIHIYIIHPVEVALILTEIEMDSASICAALLHDVIEDTDMSYYTLVQEFGEEIALLVDGVTKLSRINFKSKEDAQAETVSYTHLDVYKRQPRRRTHRRSWCPSLHPDNSRSNPETCRPYT